MLHPHALSWFAPSLVSILLIAGGCSGDDGGGQGTEGTAGSSGHGSTAATGSSGTSTSTTAAASTTDATGTGTAATTSTSATTTESTGTTSDTGTGGSSGTAGTGGSSGSSGGTGGGVTECTGKDPGNVCGPMAGCFASSCCDSAGFCAPKDAPTCGGLIGEACPDGLVCVLDACVADAQGVCVTAEVAAELEASQGTCWTFSGGKP